MKHSRSDSKYRAKVNSQGQIIIPRRLLEKHGYQTGDWVRICLGRKHITLKRITENGEGEGLDYPQEPDWDLFFECVLSKRKS